MASCNPIIYRSHTNHVFLLDLPRSIQHAQSSPFPIRSTSPLANPYPTTEPKGAKRTKFLQGLDPARLASISQLEHDISTALSQIRSSIDPEGLPWCYLRRTHKEQLPIGDQSSLDSLYGRSPSPAGGSHEVSNSAPIILSSTDGFTLFESLSEISNNVVMNPGPSTLIEVNGSKLVIPPKSTFICSTIQAGRRVFSASSSLLTDPAEAGIAGRFDLILMDPPWSNRSVRRKASYTTDKRWAESAFSSTLPILKHHLKPRGIVAVWITNKDAVEQEVFSSLQSLGLALCQEWIWVKVTLTGQPVTELDGVWRKPYEKLLLFSNTRSQVLRRIIVAVPDAHSRKPSLKCMFDSILSSGYQALELFARSLTTGWWAWGDQVLHFQNLKEWG